MKSGTGYCTHCQKQMLIHKNGVNHILHLILSVITLGAWMVVWVLLWFFKLFGSWRCSQCGNRVSFGSRESNYIR